MDNEHERPDSEGRGSSPEPPERVRLPGYDEPPHGPAYDWQGHDWQGYDYGPARGYRGSPRDGGVRASRRASTWTAAALIAGVAATTGYLAHSIPASGAGSGGTSGGTAKPATSPATVSPSTPAVKPPVVTSGGSGAAGGGGGGDN